MHIAYCYDCSNEVLRTYEFRPQIQRASLFVTLLDVNDNNPNFKEKLYNVMLQENLPKNTEILIVSAEDADKNRTITYR